MVPLSTKNTSAPRVLIVEDNLVALHLLEKITLKIGCQTTTITNGEEALDLIKTKYFDLMITDIGLPGMSGDELSRLIREWESHSPTRQAMIIIGLTALSLNNAEEQCLAAGMDKLLSKPIQQDSIEKILTDFFPLQQTPSTEQAQKPSSNPVTPNTKELQLAQYPLLDIEQGIKNVGNEKILKDLLQVMASKSLPEDRIYIKQAYENRNWSRVEELVHKMKAGTLYCGTVRLQHACLHFEQYRKTGDSALLEKLYQQLMCVMEETELYLERWLRRSS